MSTFAVALLWSAWIEIVDNHANRGMSLSRSCGARGLKFAVTEYLHDVARSRSCGARGLKFQYIDICLAKATSRSCGARGLKCPSMPHTVRRLPSRSCGARGLKYAGTVAEFDRMMSRSCGARGLKLREVDAQARRSWSRSCGARGLKCLGDVVINKVLQSRSLRSAWILVRGSLWGAIPLPSSFFRCIFPVFLACGHCSIIGEPLPIR